MMRLEAYLNGLQVALNKAMGACYEPTVPDVRLKEWKYIRQNGTEEEELGPEPLADLMCSLGPGGDILVIIWIAPSRLLHNFVPHTSLPKPRRQLFTALSFLAGLSQMVSCCTWSAGGKQAQNNCQSHIRHVH